MTRMRAWFVVAATLAMMVAVVSSPASADDVGANDFRISDLGPDGNISYSAAVSAVAYNPVNDRYLVVWYGDDNSASLVDGEFEIFGQLIDADGASIGQDFRISDMGPDGITSYFAANPAVAHNPDHNEFLVVWYGDDNTAPLVDN